ncbi:hypothetical protein [Leucobacter tenebrionis]|uniref:hypothetical protein n=1 Tax=Leucobacter tenebrionis TaxID=2873270 RepID=UPI001CA691C6|nr:hypothetical protein [Leucobacter tenebrionis]QZY51408.1 hypothetical protein KVY00_12650 [Leucobacter tenebrionis]
MGKVRRHDILGQREFFALEAGECAESAGADEAVELREFYAEAEAEFAAARVRWDRLDKLVWGDEEDPTRPREGRGTDIAILDPSEEHRPEQEGFNRSGPASTSTSKLIRLSRISDSLIP